MGNKGKSKNKRRKPWGYSETEFSEASLPHNRFEVFADLVKTRWRLFLLIGAILFLFFLPLIGSLAAENLYSSSLYASYKNGEIEAGAYQSQLFAEKCLFLLVEFLCLLLLSIPFAGLGRVYRLLVHYEPLEFKSDFARGLKENASHVFALFFIASLLFCLSSVLSSYFMVSGSKDFWQTIVFFAPIFVFFVLFFPSFTLVYCQIPFYNNPFSLSLKNGFKLYLGSLLQAFLFAFLSIAPLFLLMLGNFYVVLVTISLFPLIYLPLSLLALFLGSVSIFDRSINKNEYPELVDKGIFRIKKK